MTADVASTLGDLHSKEDWRQDYVDKARRYYENVAKAHVPAPKTAVNIEHSGPQGKVKPFTIIDDPADWKRSDWVGQEAEYTYQFTPEDAAELSAAVDALRARGVASEDDIIALTKADYALPTLGPKLVELAKSVTFGRGFQLLKGFPVEQYRHDKVGLVLAFWAILAHLGRPLVSQTDYDHEREGEFYGSILNHITVGRHSKAPDSVANAEEKDRIRLVFHSDQGATDIISLLSLKNGRAGGISKWVSSIAIHNELLRRGRMDLVEELAKPWNVPRKLNQQTYERDAKGQLIKEPTLPFEYHDGYLSVYYQSNNYQEVEKQLTPLQEEAIWAVAALAEDPEMHFAELLEQGTMLWIHNPSIFHSRTEVVDGETNDQKRHLLRFWVDTFANNRPIAPTFAPRSSVQEKGGFRYTPGTRIRLPLVPPSRPDALD